MHLEIDGGGGQLHPDAGAGDGQAVSDADRGHFYDYGAGDGGDGAGGAGGGEGGGGGDDGDRVDHAGGDGEGVAVCDPGGGADGGRRRRDGDHGVAGARDHRSRVHDVPAAELLDDEEQTYPSRPSRVEEVLSVVPQTYGAQRDEVGV